MERFRSLTADIDDATAERDAIATDIGAELADHIEDAVADHGASLTAVDRSDRDGRFRFEARLDRAAVVAALTDSLPEGFVVSHLNDDGSLSVEWTGSGRTPTGRNHDAVLKAIVAEETTIDEDGFITSVPSRDRVLDRAAEFGVPREQATDRMDRLVRLDMVDVDDGLVYPDENFSRV
jgi:hypothetical protein